MIRENYYGRTNPNHNRVSKPFPNFEANNPSDVFTQKCLCTTQEYFLPLEMESSEIEQLEIRQRIAVVCLHTTISLWNYNQVNSKH